MVVREYCVDNQEQPYEYFKVLECEVLLIIVFLLQMVRDVGLNNILIDVVIILVLAPKVG
jgi:hypothetical protein